MPSKKSDPTQNRKLLVPPTKRVNYKKDKNARRMKETKASRKIVNP